MGLLHPIDGEFAACNVVVIMPDESSSDLLQWNEENLSMVLGEIFRQSEADPSVRRQLLDDPFELLKTRIAIPEDYRGGLFARENGKKSLLIHVPTSAVSARALPEGTVDATTPSAFEPLCSLPIW